MVNKIVSKRIFFNEFVLIFLLNTHTKSILLVAIDENVNYNDLFCQESIEGNAFDVILLCFIIYFLAQLYSTLPI